MRRLFIFLLLLAAAAHAEIISGRVVSISDGDTLTIAEATKQSHTIRLLGIDAPEITQDFGQKARTTLSAFALNQHATAKCKQVERSRGKQCVVVVGGSDVGLEQLRAGMAWWYRQHNAQQSAKERTDYEQAEFMAKIRRFGLWNSKNPMPPWDWRRGRPEE